MIIAALARKLFRSRHERKLKEYRTTLQAIAHLEPEIAALSDSELQGQTALFRTALAQTASLDTVLPRAFAIVREAAKRTLGQRPYDVQIMGGLALHEGCIAEMRTGEGKTLAATLPAYLNALMGEGVHVVTVNDYLAARDAEWMGRIYRFLGMEVGVVVHGMDDSARRAAYRADITYGANNEFGFDYLRDNMKYERDSMVQRGHAFAIVDEVDSILIDEARTPLIISGPLELRSEFYTLIDSYIPRLTKEDYQVDEKSRSAHFTEIGNEKLERLLKEEGLLKGDSLYEIENVALVHHLQQALKAHCLFQKNRDYILRKGEVVIIDEFTGRMMPGRRYGDGLHQALEAKEGARIQPENQTLASVTFQNYFRLYKKLAGMTGTALTEAEEFLDIYGLDVLEIPPNVPPRRRDEDDEIYRTANEKYTAVLTLIEACHEKGQPILVGTTSIEKSEILAERLKKAGYKQLDVAHPKSFCQVTHQRTDGSNPKVFTVLNARYHEQEALIISQAGVPGSVTIATNMAGRGTDIQLGGNLEMRLAHELTECTSEAERKEKEEAVRAEIAALKQKALEAGGLYVIGTERHESRRIDNQLRGRSGRQGDPGQSKFFLSLEDDLLRIFGSERMDFMMRKLGLQEGEAIVHPWINKALEKAQKKVEARNFDIRKNLLRYDDVMNEQRKVIFEQRLALMREESLADTIVDMRHDVIETLVAAHIPPRSYVEQWDIEGLTAEFEEVTGIKAPLRAWSEEEEITEGEIAGRLKDSADRAAALKLANYGSEVMRKVEKTLLLHSLDYLWREHLAKLDHLRSVIGFRGYAQRDPLQEYKTEAFSLFESLLSELRLSVTKQLMHVTLVESEEVPPFMPPPPRRA